MIRQGVILAGGLGSRLYNEDSFTPKPLIHVGGMALIERIIVLMKNAGIELIVIVLGHQSEQIVNFIRDREYRGFVTVINNEYKKIFKIIFEP